MSCYPLHLYIRFYCEMKVALVKLIWKSADLSSALPDPDSCMEMRSLYRRTLFCGESMQALLFFSPPKKKKNEELWPDAHSLRGWKFNLEMAHISKPTIIGILCSVFLTTYISRFSVMAGNRAYMTQLDILLIKPLNP